WGHPHRHHPAVGTRCRRRRDPLRRRGVRHRVLRQGALRIVLSRLPDRPGRIRAGLRLRPGRLARTVLRLPARRARQRRAQHPDRAAGRPVELGVRTASDGPALRALPLPRRARARPRSPAPDAAGGRRPHVGRHAGVEEPAARGRPSHHVDRRPHDRVAAAGRPPVLRVGELPRSASSVRPAASLVRPLSPPRPPRPWCPRPPPADMLAVLPAAHPEEFDGKPDFHRLWTTGFRGTEWEWTNPGWSLFTEEEQCTILAHYYGMIAQLDHGIA